MKVRQVPFRPDFQLSADIVGGRYRLGTPVGSGGVADVYRGADLRLRRPVAVKVFRPGTDTDMEERFTQEAVLLARLHHPGLVTVYDAGRHQGCAYLVMQLVQGPTLRQVIASSSPLEPGTVADLGAALAHALAHVHTAGIVHRDVKPSNILLDGAGRPHLTDFGISRLIAASTCTASGALIGTAAYMAPEQVLGKGARCAADIYALGLVLLECLKGELEYDGAPLEAAIARLHRSPVLPGNLPPRLADLLYAMTAVDEYARPDAQQCADALTALRDEAVSVARPAGAPLTGHRARRIGALSPMEKGGVHEETARLVSAEAGHGGHATARHARDRRNRRLLAATSTAALTALLGATLTASESMAEHTAQPAVHSAEPSPARTPSAQPPDPEDQASSGDSPAQARSVTTRDQQDSAAPSAVTPQHRPATVRRIAIKAHKAGTAPPGAPAATMPRRSHDNRGGAEDPSVAPYDEGATGGYDEGAGGSGDTEDSAFGEYEQGATKEAAPGGKRRAPKAKLRLKPVAPVVPVVIHLSGAERTCSRAAGEPPRSPAPAATAVSDTLPSCGDNG